MNRFVDIIGVGDVNIITVFGFKEDISPVRVDQSDLIFIFGAKDSLSDDFWNHLRPNVQVYGIGTKNYGQSNGSIYRHRFDPDYFDQTVPLNSEYEALNREWQKQWGDHYIDMIAYSTVSPGRIRVFSTDHKFISQDCEHLTRGGAQYYASIIDLDPFFIVSQNEKICAEWGIHGRVAFGWTCDFHWRVARNNRKSKRLFFALVLSGVLALMIFVVIICFDSYYLTEGNKNMAELICTRSLAEHMNALHSKCDAKTSYEA